jgi:hypothetical protein
VSAIPVVGWTMAPAAAAEAYAAVAAMAGPASLDVGAWNVPRDMTANIHKGETVVPTNFAEGMRQSGGFGGAGGGGDTHLHMNISAIDGASVANLVHSQGFRDEIAKSVGKHINRGGRF